MIKRLMSAFGWVRRDDLDKANFERDMAIAQVGKLRLRLAARSIREVTLDKYMALKRDLEECRKQLARKEAQYADAVSRWAGLARLWQEEHGGGLVYVKGTADGGVQVWDEAVGDGCEPSAVIELKPIWKAVADGGDEERKEEESENVALEAAAVSAGCAAEGAKTGADRDPAELAGQGNAGASAGEQGDGIPKG